MQCQCLTLQGKPCKRDAKSGSQYCYQHQNCQKIIGTSKQKIGKKSQTSKKSATKSKPKPKLKTLKKQQSDEDFSSDSVSLSQRLYNYGAIKNMMFGDKDFISFDDIGSDDGHSDFAHYLAGRGYDPQEMKRVMKKWDTDNYKYSKDPEVQKLNKLRMDFIQENRPEMWDAFRAGLGHTWPILGLDQDWSVLKEIAKVGGESEEGEDDIDVLEALSHMPQFK